MSDSPRKCPVLKAVLGGLVLGVVLVAVLAWGMKTTDARPFCSTCHIMNPEARTHKMSAHANLTCNECHAPAHLAEKLPFKARSGLNDVFVNLFGTKPEIIFTDTSMKDVINTNCKSCHVMTNVNVASMEAKPYCSDCHRGVAHPNKQPIATRMVADQ